VNLVTEDFRAMPISICGLREKRFSEGCPLIHESTGNFVIYYAQSCYLEIMSDRQYYKKKGAHWASQFFAPWSVNQLYKAKKKNTGIFLRRREMLSHCGISLTA
jgi:hypothetical protein